MRQLLVFVTVLLLAACSAQPPAQPETKPAARNSDAAPVPDDAPVIVAFGDSLTAGYGLAPSESYPSLLQELLYRKGLACRVINEGVSGDTSAMALARVDAAASHGAVLAFVAIGANDALRGLPIDEMEHNLREIVKHFQDAGTQVALAGMLAPPNLGPEYADAFAAVYPRVAEDLDLPLLPFLLEGVAAEPELNQEDGIHPNVRGERIVADLVANFVAPLLRSPPQITTE